MQRGRLMKFNTSINYKLDCYEIFNGFW